MNTGEDLQDSESDDNESGSFDHEELHDSEIDGFIDGFSGELMGQNGREGYVDTRKPSYRAFAFP